MRSGFRIAIVPTILATLTLLVLPVVSTDAFAHRIGRRHHHRRGRVVVVVGRPVRLVRPVIIGGRPHGVIDLNIKPKQTEVFVDGTLRGQVDDFDGHPGKLNLRPGTHKIVLRTPDGKTYKRKVKVVAGHEINLKLDLEDDDSKAD